MDPNATHRILVESARDILRKFDSDSGSIQDDAIALAEAVQAIDEWLSRGGFLPTAWNR